MTDADDKRSREILRASFRRINDDVLELRRSAQEGWFRIVAWMIMGCALAVYISEGDLKGATRYVETLHKAINPDKFILPSFERHNKTYDEIIAEGNIPFSTKETYEEYRKGYLENSQIYRNAIELIVITLFWLAGAMFPRQPPLRIDRRRKLVYSCNSGRYFIVHSRRAHNLFAEKNWRIDFPVNWKKWQYPSLIMTHYHHVDRYEQRPPQPPQLHRKHCAFDVGIFPPKNGVQQTQVIQQFLQDFVNHRDNPYLAEIGKRYRVRNPLQWILNLTFWPWSGRFNEEKAEAAIKQQLAMWQEDWNSREAEVINDKPMTFVKRDILVYVTIFSVFGILSFLILG